MFSRNCLLKAKEKMIPLSITLRSQSWHWSYGLSRGPWIEGGEETYPSPRTSLSRCRYTVLGQSPTALPMPTWKCRWARRQFIEKGSHITTHDGIKGAGWAEGEVDLQPSQWRVQPILWHISEPDRMSFKVVPNCGEGIRPYTPVWTSHCMWAAPGEGRTLGKITLFSASWSVVIALTAWTSPANLLKI